MTLVTFGSFKKTVLELPRNSGWAAASHEDLFKAWKDWSAALLRKERKNTHAECEAFFRARPKPPVAEVPWTVTDKAGKRGTAAKRSSSAAKKSDIEDTQKIHLELPAWWWCRSPGYGKIGIRDRTLHFRPGFTSGRFASSVYE